MKKFFSYNTVLFNKRQLMMLGALCITFLGTSILETVSVGALYPFFTSLLNPEAITEQKWYLLLSYWVKLDSVTKYLVLFLILLITLYLVKTVALLGAARFQVRTLTRLRCDISKELYAKVLSQEYSVLKHKNTAEIQRTLTTDVSYTFNAVSAAMTMVQQAITGIAFVGILICMDPILTFGMSVLMVAVYFLYQKMSGRLTTTAGKKARTAFIGMLQTTRESIGMIKLVLVSGKQKYFVDRYNQFTEEHAQQEQKSLFFQKIPRIIFEVVVMCGVLLYILVLICTDGDFLGRLPVFITFALATVKLIPVVSSLASNSNTIRFCLAPFERVCEVVREKPAGEVAGEPMEKPMDEMGPKALTRGVEVVDLQFAYEDGITLLNQVSIEIPANKITGFIGKTGSGKTTMADLILGLYEPISGDILIDGMPLQEMRKWWAGKVGYVTQAVVLQDSTIRENLTWGLEKEADEEKLWSCLRAVQMEEFVLKLPDGLDTRTGENGARLSGGQIQRLGIARALYHDPVFLVLDESTSALDHETEAAVLQTLQNIREGRTILLITHRDTAMNICDRVYDFTNGEVHCTKQ